MLLGDVSLQQPVEASPLQPLDEVEVAQVVQVGRDQEPPQPPVPGPWLNALYYLAPPPDVLSVHPLGAVEVGEAPSLQGGGDPLPPGQGLPRFHGEASDPDPEPVPPELPSPQLPSVGIGPVDPDGESRLDEPVHLGGLTVVEPAQVEAESLRRDRTDVLEPRIAHRCPPQAEQGSQIPGHPPRAGSASGQINEKMLPRALRLEGGDLLHHEVLERLADPTPRSG